MVEKMSNFPINTNRHFDVLQHHKDGGLLLGASSLFGKYWTGSLWFFKNPDEAADFELCSAGVQLETGLADAQWIDESRFVIATDSGAVSLMELTDECSTINTLSLPKEHDDVVNSVSINSNQTVAVSGSHDRRVKLWDLEEGLSTKSYKAHSDIVWCVACHPQEQDLFLSASQDGNVLLWDTRNPKPATIIAMPSTDVIPTSVAWQPVAEYPSSIVIGAQNGKLIFMDSRQGVGPTAYSQPHQRSIHRLSFAPHRSDWVASVSEDCTVAVTELVNKEAATIYKDSRHTDFVQGVSWSPQNKKLYTCSWDSTVLSHDVKNEESRADSHNIIDMETVRC